LISNSVVILARDSIFSGGEADIDMGTNSGTSSTQPGEFQGHCNKGGKNGQGQIGRRKLAIGTSAESHPHTPTVSVIKRGDPEGGDFIGVRGEYEKRVPGRPVLHND
jgi:hypothetical protein